MHNEYLRVYDVAKMFGVGKSTIWHWLKNGKFVQPIKLGNRVTVWKLSEIDEFIANSKSRM